MENLYKNSIVYKLFALALIYYNNSKTKIAADTFAHYCKESAIAKWYGRFIAKQSAMPQSLYNKILDIISAKISIITAIIHNMFAGYESVIYKKFVKGSLIFRYETASYILCMYVFLDYFIRTYIGGFKASLWDKLYFVVLLCVWAYLWIKNKNDKIVTTPLDCPLFIFYGAALMVFILNTINFSQSLEGMRAAVQNTLWFLALNQIIRSKTNAVNIFRALVYAVLIISLHGIYQYIIGVEMPPNWVDSLETGIRTRVFSIIGSPNILASVITLISPIALGFMFAEKKLAVKAAYLCIFGAMSLCLVFTFSRGAWIGYLAAIGIFALVKDKRLFAPAVFCVLIVSAVVPSVTSRLTYMLSPEYIQSSLRAGRLVRWIEGINIVRVRPVLGVGHGAFGGAVAVNSEVVGAFYMDNYFLKTAVEMGLVGFTAFVILMASVVIWSMRVCHQINDAFCKQLAIGALAGLSGIIIHNFVENVFEVPMMVTYFWLICAVMMFFYRECK